MPVGSHSHGRICHIKFYCYRLDAVWVVCNYFPPGNVIPEFRQNVPMKIPKAAKEIEEKEKLLEKTAKDETAPKSNDAHKLPFSEVFINQFVIEHNIYRFMHHSPPLKLSPMLTELAQNWSDVRNCILYIGIYFFKNIN